MSDWVAIQARVDVVVDALGLPDAAIHAAVASEEALDAFAAVHGQSLHWLVTGDIRPMLRMVRKAD